MSRIFHFSEVENGELGAGDGARARGSLSKVRDSASRSEVGVREVRKVLVGGALASASRAAKAALRLSLIYLYARIIVGQGNDGGRGKEEERGEKVRSPTAHPIYVHPAGMPGG